VWPRTLRRWERAGKLKPLEQYFQSYGVGIDIMEQDEDKSAQEELVEDMIAIITSFSARIYGKRGADVAKKLTEMLEQEVDASENHG